MALHPVILCGGSGTRLWPASRPDRPKQFLKLTGGLSTYQTTLERSRAVAPGAVPLIVTGAAHLDAVQAQAAELGMAIRVLVEPMARNSGPAIAAATALLAGEDPDAVLFAQAADHHVGDLALFLEATAAAVRGAELGRIACFGIRPDQPSPAYGYIRPGAPLAKGVAEIAAFVEKPDVETARRYLDEGFVWNGGNFTYRAEVMLGELAAHEPAMATAAQAAVAAARTEGNVIRLDLESFAMAPAIAIDIAVMERTKLAAVALAEFPWSDLGAWDAVQDILDRDGAGNAVDGPVLVQDVTGSLVRSDGPKVAVIGLSDVVVVVEDGRVLVCSRDAAQKVGTLGKAFEQG